MDGVSTAISLFSSGYTAFKKVREVRKAIKDAPGQLDSLERSCALIEHLLNNLKAVSSCLPAHNDLHHLDHLSEQAQHHFEEVQKIANKVTKGHSNEDRSTGERKIRPFRWILHKESIERVEVEMKELQNMLGILLVSVQQCVSATSSKRNIAISYGVQALLHIITYESEQRRECTHYSITSRSIVSTPSTLPFNIL